MAEDGDAVPEEARGKVLYIEDQEINLQLVEAILANSPGIELIKATTGAQGVQLVRSQHPDVVLLDMHLPDFGGLEVVRELSLEIAEGLKVALLTADVLSMDILKAMSLGAYEYWTKPIEPQQLEDGIRRALKSVNAERRRRLSR
jgi:two-component system cell cycle response regulator DivK